MDNTTKYYKLKGSSNYNIQEIKINSILIKEECLDGTTIKLINFNLTNYLNEDNLIEIKAKFTKALAIIRLLLDNNPLIITKLETSPKKLLNKFKELYR